MVLHQEYLVVIIDIKWIALASEMVFIFIQVHLNNHPFIKQTPNNYKTGCLFFSSDELQ